MEPTTVSAIIGAAAVCTTFGSILLTRMTLVRGQNKNSESSAIIEVRVAAAAAIEATRAAVTAAERVASLELRTAERIAVLETRAAMLLDEVMRLRTLHDHAVQAAVLERKVAALTAEMNTIVRDTSVNLPAPAR